MLSRKGDSQERAHVQSSNLLASKAKVTASKTLALLGRAMAVEKRSLERHASSLIRRSQPVVLTLRTNINCITDQ